MNFSHYVNYDEAIRAVIEAQSARMRQLTTLEAYVDGTQYAGRPDWFSQDRPLWERAPCVVYPIAKCAIDSNVDLVLGDQRFPKLAVPVSDDALENGLKKEDAELVNKWLMELETHTRLRPVCREMFHSAQASSSACAIVAIRGGRPVIDTTKAAWATPTLDIDGNVTKLVIEYPYLQQSRKPDGKWRVDAMLYRRVIDETSDVTFAPAKCDGTKPKWTAQTTVSHGLGFCPVIWYAHQKGCSTVAEVDGKAIHGHLLDEITALDFTLSQRHRAAMYAGDPQWTEVGVEPGYNPTSAGRSAAVGSSMAGGFVSSNEVTGHYREAVKNSVRKKSPGDVWQYDNPETKVQLHTLPGDALSSLDNHAKDLKSKICEALGVSFLDPENIPRGGELSSTTVKTLKARQFDRCDSYRSDFGDLCLRPIVTMLIRIVTTRPTGLKLPGLVKVAPLLEQLQERGLLLKLNWGPYTVPAPAEELALIQAATTALDMGIATKRSAVLMAQDVLHVDDIAQHLLDLEEEATKKADEAQKMLVAQTEAKAAAAPKKPTE